MEGKFLSFPCCFLREKVPLKAPPAQNDRKGSRAFKGTSRFPRPPTLRAIVASSLATDVGALLFRLYWPLELPSLPRGNFEDPIPRSGLIRTFGFRRRNRPPYLPEGGSRGANRRIDTFIDKLIERTIHERIHDVNS